MTFVCGFESSRNHVLLFLFEQTFADIFVSDFEPRRVGLIGSW